MVNVAVWHKTDQKDEAHPICRVRFTVADVGRPLSVFLLLLLLFICWMCLLERILSSEAA